LRRATLVDQKAPSILAKHVVDMLTVNGSLTKSDVRANDEWHAG
jgi:hypothetical protein